MEQAPNSVTNVKFVFKVPTKYAGESLKEEVVINSDFILRVTIKAPEELLKKVSSNFDRSLTHLVYSVCIGSQTSLKPKTALRCTLVGARA